LEDPVCSGGEQGNPWRRWVITISISAIRTVQAARILADVSQFKGEDGLVEYQLSGARSVIDSGRVSYDDWLAEGHGRI
jgi:hypothetical protein